MLNNSGCVDITAYEAMKAVRREERRNLIVELKALANKHGYRIVSTIHLKDKFNTMTIDGFGYFEKEQAGKALIERCKQMKSEDPTPIGDYRGFSMEISFDSFQKQFYLSLVGEISHKVDLGTNVFGNIQRIDNALENIEKRLEIAKEELNNTKTQFETAKIEAERPFPQEAELQEKTKCLAAVEALLKMDKKDTGVIDTDVSDVEIFQQRREYDMAR